MRSQVSLIKCESYDQEIIDNSLEKLFASLGGVEKFIKADQKVLLKINLLSGKEPEKAVTTHPSLIRGMIKLIKKQKAIPIVGDSPASEGNNNYEKYLKICKITGVKDAVEETGAKLVHFNASREDIFNPKALAFKRFTVTGELSKMDVLINMPKFKTHGLTMLTGAVKNMFGCVSGMLKGQLHMRAPHRPQFSQMVVDLYSSIKPNLTIMDAVLGMDGNGPGSGNPKPIGALLAGEDGVAVDSVACQICNIDPYSLFTCRLGEEQNMGIADPENIEILGERIESFKVENFDFKINDASEKGLLNFIIKTLRTPTTAKPVIDQVKCSKCKECIEQCQSKAMTFNVNKVLIDYNTCIRCYCCQEICPEGAITLKKGFLYRLLARA